MSAPARSAWWWLLLPLAVGLLIYLPPCFGADWISDDRPLIAHHLRPGDILGEWTTSTHEHAANIQGGYLWRPLTSTLYQLWGGLFGRQPTPFRLLSLLVHLLNTGLVFAAGRRLGAGARTAGLVTVAWAVHPLLPDAVSWVADLYDVLASTFLLGSLLVATHRSRMAVPGSALLFFGALLCKEAPLAWVGALPLALWLLRGWRPALAQGLVLGAVGLVHNRWHTAIVGTFEHGTGDFLRSPDFLPLWLDYLRWPLHMPVRAGFIHLVDPGATPWSLLGILFIGSGIAAGIAGLVGRGSWTRSYAVAIGVYGLLLSPAAVAAVAFLSQPARYLYLPMTLAVPFLAVAAERIPLPSRWMAPALASAWCLAMAPPAWQRARDFAGEPTLYEAEHAWEPDNPFGKMALGRGLVEQGKLAEGLALWKEAIDHPPASTFVMDVQRERLDWSVQAARVGAVPQALEVLEIFVREEEEAGRPLEPSVTALIDQLEAQAP